MVQDAKQSRESQLWDMWTQPVTVRLNGDIEYATDTWWQKDLLDETKGTD